MKIGSHGFVAEKSNQSNNGWKIYHNPRCRKSCEALDLLWQNDIHPEIIEYLEVPLQKEEIRRLLFLLKGEPKEILRTKESIFSTLDIDLTNVEQMITAIVEHPELLERPIVIYGDKGIIARPAERILEIESGLKADFTSVSSSQVENTAFF